MSRLGILVLLILFMVSGTPAYAYGDPSGGALFQILMPTLAAIWAMWMIFANRVRRGLGNLLRKLRGSTSKKTSVPRSELLATEEQGDEFSSQLP